MKLLSLAGLTCLGLLFFPLIIKASPVLTSVTLSGQTPAQLVPGGSATYTVTVKRVDNGNMDVYLSISGLPTGATASFSPSMVHFTGPSPDSLTATLTISSPAQTTGCSNSFTVTGTDGSSWNYKTSQGALTMTCAPQPAVLAGTCMPDGSFHVVCNTSPSQTCLIQATTDLGSHIWTTIGTNTADSNGILSYIDTDAKNYPMRFYRTAAY